MKTATYRCSCGQTRTILDNPHRTGTSYQGFPEYLFCGMYGCKKRMVRERARIEQRGGDMIRGLPTEVHWSLYFDDLFIADTSAESILEQFQEMVKLINRPN